MLERLSEIHLRLGKECVAGAFVISGSSSRLRKLGNVNAIKVPSV
jgi:hypothetical protein